MTIERKRPYGYMSAEPKEREWIDMPKGQNISGYGVGILHLDDVWYPMVPGNVVNAWTYDFPVRLKAVKGLDTPTLHSGSPEVFELILAAAKELEKEGCRAISAACGFFGHFHRQLADEMDMPVGLSSLVQIPWIRATMKTGSRIGILTANAAAVSDSLLQQCGVTGSDDLVIADLRHGENFSAIMEDRGSFDNAGTRREVTEAARKLVEEDPRIGAILLECSDMPPYAWAVQAVTGRPVYDFITLIRWLNNAAMQRPYDGWI
ncbi:MAG: aspartate/glutamate racemase family protein [Firmicutes bacterium]|nr:aspartate/glutamate racemase family protein [Bacillota bacterium]